MPHARRGWVRHQQVCTRVDSEGRKNCCSSCPARGSNPGSSDSNSDALTTELYDTLFADAHRISLLLLLFVCSLCFFVLLLTYSAECLQSSCTIFHLNVHKVRKAKWEHGQYFSAQSVHTPSAVKGLKTSKPSYDGQPQSPATNNVK